MGWYAEHYPLAAATLSGGARIAEAEGDLPRRITTEADFYDDAGIRMGGVLLDPDGIHVWCCRAGSHYTYKRRISDGETILTCSSPYPWPHFFDLDRRKLVVCASTAQSYSEIDMDTGAVVNVGAPAATTYGTTRVPGVTDRIWSIQGYSATNVTAVESTWPGRVLTGRSISLGVSGYGMGGGIKSGLGPDGVLSIWIGSEASRIRRFAYSEDAALTLLDEWTFLAGATGNMIVAPGCVGSYPRNMDIDPTDGRVVVHGNLGLDKASAAGAAGLAAWERVFGGGSAEDGATGGSAGGGYNVGHALSLSSRYAAFAVARTVGDSMNYAVRVVNRQTQRATWRRAATGVAATLVFPILAGDLGNEVGAVVGVGDRLVERTKCYVQVDGGAEQRVYPGRYSGIAIGADSVVDFHVDFNRWGAPAGPPPWIGGQNPNNPDDDNPATAMGVQLLVDDPSRTTFVPYSTPACRLRQLAQPAYRLRMSPP